MVTVWLVDDEPGILSSLEMAIDEAIERAQTSKADRVTNRLTNLKTRKCARGLDFLDAHTAGEDAVLILDLHLLDISGMSVLRELERSKRTLPTLLMTGDPSLSEALAAEPRDWIEAIFLKPFPTSELLDILLKVLQR